MENVGLYLRAGEAAGLRRRFESVPHLAERWRMLRQNADGVLREAVASGPLDITRTRAALGKAGLCAFVYALTGERPYADRALREANALLGEPQWTKPAPNNRGANLATGEASAACALVYDWCRAAMTDAERAAFRDRLWTLGIQPYQAAVGPLKDWWRDNDVTNWSGVVNGGCGLAALALAEDRPDAREVARFAWDRIVAFLKTANRMDGGGDEGVMYYTYGMLFANYFAVAAARRFGDDRGVFRDAAEKMSGYYLIGMQGPDGRYANFNDMGDETFADLPPKNREGGPNATLCALWEAKTPGGDPLLAWAADHGGDNWYWRGVSPFSLLFRGSSPAVRSEPAFPRSVLFRESGQAVWDAAPNLWFAFNGGWTSDRSHYNLDLGSFILVVNGERLIHDPGYGKIHTGDHSTLLVDGIEQTKNVQGVYSAWAEGPGWRWLACDLSSVYGTAASNPLTRWIRNAVLLEGPDAPCLLILDELAASRSARFETRLQIQGTSTVDSENASAFVRKNKAALSIDWSAVSSGGRAEIGEGRGVSPYLYSRLPVGQEAFIGTLLRPTEAKGSPETPPLVILSGTDGNISITISTKQKQQRKLVFGAQTRSGTGSRSLLSLDGKPTPNTPGASRRSLRRVS